MSAELKGDTFSKLQHAVELINRSGDKIDAANVRKRIPTLATATIKLPKLTAVSSGTSKTLAKSTSIVPQKTFHNFFVLLFLPKLKLISLVVKN